MLGLQQVSPRYWYFCAQQPPSNRIRQQLENFYYQIILTCRFVVFCPNFIRNYPSYFFDERFIEHGSQADRLGKNGCNPRPPDPVQALVPPVISWNVQA